MSDLIACPMCFCKYPGDKIERHAFTCDGTPKGDAAGGGGGGGDGGGRMGACPICEDMFPASEIAMHASRCMGKGAPAAGGGPMGGAGGRCITAGCRGAAEAKTGGLCNSCFKAAGGERILNPTAKKTVRIGVRTIEVRQGDITRETADAIVNAANDKMDHASGVAGALSAAAGPEMQTESYAKVAEWGGSIPTGECIVTKGGNLRCKNVFTPWVPSTRAGTSARRSSSRRASAAASRRRRS